MENGISGITTFFFGFDDFPELEQKVRELLSPLVKIGMYPIDASKCIGDAFKENGINNVMFVTEGYLGFWKI